MGLIMFGCQAATAREGLAFCIGKSVSHERAETQPRCGAAELRINILDEQRLYIISPI